MSEESVKIHLPERSGDFLLLMSEHGISIQLRRSLEIQNASQTVEIVREAGSLVPCAALAAVIIAWLKRHSRRKVILTLRDNVIVQVEGHSPKELTEILERTRNIMLADPKPRGEGSVPETSP